MTIDHSKPCGAEPPKGKARMSNHRVPRELPSACNRPAGHEGRHIFWRDDKPTIEWGRDER